MRNVSGVRMIRRAPIRRILIRATNWVGDAVMTLPALEAVRENFPSSHIAVLAKPWVAAVFKGHPAVNRVMVYEKHDGQFMGSGGVIKTAGRIRRGRFDLAILFQNAFEAALLVYLGGVRLRLGYDRDKRGVFLTHGLPPASAPHNVHQVEYYLALLRSVGWEAESRDPVLHIPEAWSASASRFLSLRGIKRGFLLGLAPGAVYGEAKRWSARRFAMIGDWAVEAWGAQVLIFGSDKEKAICREVSDAMQHPCVNICGQTPLSVAIALINRCGFFLSNDSGLMHVAAALGVPTVAVFGSTDPVATGPRGPKSVIVRKPLSCAPCLKPTCSMNYKCMRAVTPMQVQKAMERLRSKTK